MTGFSRYAIYFAPSGDLARFGARWLGWDMQTGCAIHAPELLQQVPELSAVTEKPRKYGFHGTLKAPFRLAQGEGLAALDDAIASFAATAVAASAGPLSVAHLGRFLALRPTGDSTALGAQAFDIVTRFDRFRAPLSDADMVRRRAAGLSPAQDALLVAWGYPFVGPEFRFHLTLSGPVQDDAAPRLLSVLRDHLGPLCTAPFVLDQIALVGERAVDGHFQLIRTYRLSG